MEQSGATATAGAATTCQIQGEIYETVSYTHPNRQITAPASDSMARQLFATAVVVTNCTTRKRGSGQSVSLPPSRRRETTTALVKRWTSLTARAPLVAAAGELYAGRAFSESRVVAKQLRGELYVVSAGLGLIHEGDMVPNYNLTAGDGSGKDLYAALARRGSTTAHWWTELSKRIGDPAPLSTLVASHPGALVLVALPASYLRMVADDLANIDGRSLRRIRIFTSQAGRTAVPAQLRPCILPYDDRLESLEGYAGTRAEFPQRSLRHFVEVLSGHRLALGDGHSAVMSSLSRLRRRVTPARQKLSDDQIRTLIDEKWVICAGRSSRLLRYLRDDALVACEQGRFRDLWQEVRARRSRRERAHAA